MTFILIMVGLLLVGLLLVMTGVILLLRKINKIASLIVLAMGLLMVIISILAFLSLVITSTHMG
jgi:hypothetical protein